MNPAEFARLEKMFLELGPDITFPEFETGRVLHESEHFTVKADYKGTDQNTADQRIFIAGKDTVADEVILRANTFFQGGKSMTLIEGRPSLRYLYDEKTFRILIQPSGIPSIAMTPDSDTTATTKTELHDALGDDSPIEIRTFREKTDTIAAERMMNGLFGHGDGIVPTLQELELLYMEVSKTTQEIAPLTVKDDYLNRLLENDPRSIYAGVLIENAREHTFQAVLAALKSKKRYEALN